MKKLVLILVLVLAPLTVGAERAPEVDKEFEVLALVSGFHAASNHDDAYAFRVLEADASESVAFNPIYLFFVVIGPHGAPKLVSLPSVSAVKGVSFDKKNNITSIKAAFDAASQDGDVLSGVESGVLEISVKAVEQPHYDLQVFVERK